MAEEWQRLQALMLQLDPGFQYWIDSINAYLLKLARRQKRSPLNRVRAILIGPGEAGKTSLLRALHGEPVIHGKEVMTMGIEIRESCFDATTDRYQRQPCRHAAIEI